MIYLNVYNAILMVYLFLSWKSRGSEPWMTPFMRLVFLIGATYNIVEVFKLIGLTVKVSL